MCGRYTLEINDRFEQRFNIVESKPKLQSRYNIAPSQELPVIIENEVRIMKWGLIPFWSKTGKDQIINIRAETAAQKFKKQFCFQRCLIPATGFFEWSHFVPNTRDFVRDKSSFAASDAASRDKSRIPYLFRLKSKDYFAFAGIYDKNNYAILTTVSNDLMKPIHNRMPVILNSSDEKHWANPDHIEEDYLNSMLKPFDNNLMETFPISTRVNSPMNDEKRILIKTDPEINSG